MRRKILFICVVATNFISSRRTLVRLNNIYFARLAYEFFISHLFSKTMCAQIMTENKPTPSAVFDNLQLLQIKEAVTANCRVDG